MTWFRKEDESKIPEKLRKMSSEDIVKAIESGENTASEVTKLQDELKKRDSAIAAQTSELNETKQRLTTLEASARQRQQVDNNNNNNDKGPEFTMDPEGWVNNRVNAAFGPLAMATLQTNAQLARQNAVATLQRLKVQGTRISKGAMFDKYSTEVDALAKTTNIQQLQTPDSWIHLFNMVLGQHMEEILAAYAGGKGDEFFVEGAASSVVNHNDQPASDKPTAEEIEIAQRMKIPIEQYMKNKKEMIFA